MDKTKDQKPKIPPTLKLRRTGKNTDKKLKITKKEIEDGELKTKKEEKKTSKTATKEPSFAKITVDKKATKGEPETMEELLAETGYLLRGYKRGDMVEGEVVAVSPKEILIDVAGKTEGIVADKEMAAFKDLLMDLEVGQKIKCMVIVTENEQGQMVLSVRRAGFEIKWKKMLDAFSNKEPLEVTGVEVNRGGVIATCEGIRGFLPTSQLSSARSGKTMDIINRKIKVLVIEVNQKLNRLIFSEKAYTGDKSPVDKQELLKKISIGETYEGKVTGVVPYGLFMNINGIDGLVHISEIAWEKVNQPSDYFKTGDKVKVLVLGIEEASGKLNLSIKQLTPDPFKEAAKSFSKNMKVKGKISRLSAFGSFVTLENGVEGLIHISKVPPGKEFTIGEELECTIENVDIERRRISLAPILYEKPVGYK